ncbi:MAG TPA: FG-GAP-like repeat-containing protein [Rhizomicrobium sp.]|jgi:RHS repeat-associated protein
MASVDLAKSDVIVEECGSRAAGFRDGHFFGELPDKSIVALSLSSKANGCLHNLLDFCATKVAVAFLHTVIGAVFGIVSCGYALADHAPAAIVPGQFSVSPTGAFTYSIPISVPPGSGGMVPALSLDYSSQAGNGLEGIGWSLNGLPAIGRCPKTWAQDGVKGGVTFNINNPDSDRYCLNGQRLVLIQGSYGADNAIYRTEIDGFSEITSHCVSTCPATGPDYFKVRTKAGQTMYFGYTNDPDNLGNQSQQTFTTASSSVTRSWAVEKIVDVKSNFLIVRYFNDSYNGQSYPTVIRYTGNSSSPLTDDCKYACVKFFYDCPVSGCRQDVIPTYQAGYLVQTTKLLSNIETFVGGQLVTNYSLQYRDATSTLQPSELGVVSLCSDATATDCLHSTYFGWQGTPDSVSVNPVPNSIAHGRYVHYGNGTFFTLPGLPAADFNADGLTDLLVEQPFGKNNCPNAASAIYLGQEDGTFSAATVNTTVTENTTTGPPDNYNWYPNGPSCFYLGYTFLLDLDNDDISDVSAYNFVLGDNIFLLNNRGLVGGSSATLAQGWTKGLQVFAMADYNGDGRIDSLSDLNSATQNGYYLNTGSGFVNEPQGFHYPAYSAPPDALFVGDFDGDGCGDFMFQYANGPKTITFSPDCGPLNATWTVPNLVQNGQTVTLGDFNGDGKTDILVTAKNASGTLYLSTGAGLYTVSGFTVPSDWGKYTIVTGDWNGDGLTDIALIASGGTGMYGVTHPHLIELSTGTGFVQAATIDNNNSMDTTVGVAVADWNSDGTTDLWLQKPSGDIEELMVSTGTDDAPQFKPVLMVSVDNGIGANTEVSYDRLNKNGAFYTRGTSSYPTDNLDGPIYVVSRVDSSNGLGTCVPATGTNCYSSTYSYGQAQFDLKGRGFLGFSQMTVTDLQTTIYQTTTYGTQFPYTGLVINQSKVCPKPTCNATSDVTLSLTTNQYTPIDLGHQTGTGNDKTIDRMFVELHETTVVSNDLDGSAFPSTTTSYTYDCDSGMTSICAGASPTGFGNAVAVVTSVDGGTTKTTTSQYTNDAVNWYLGRLTTATVTATEPGFPTLTRSTSYTYDPTSGLLTSTTIEPNASDPSLTLETDYGYDAIGNLTSSDAKGCIWVLVGSTYQCVTTDPTSSRTTTSLFDATTLHGQFMTERTNALNQSETWTYSAPANVGFGLPSSHTGPNDLTTSWNYDEFGRMKEEIRPDGVAPKYNRTETSYVDCAGGTLPTGESCPSTGAFAVVATPIDGYDAQNGPIVVKYYDSLSRSVATDTQGYDASGTPPWIRTETQYDANGRLAQTSRPYFLATGTPQWTRYQYDVLGRVKLVSYPNTNSLAYTRDALSTTITNGKSQTITTVLNADGLKASVSQHGTTTSYSYDTFGELLTVSTPATGNLLTYTYDVRGRKISAFDTNMGTWTYSYDGFDELFSQTDAKPIPNVKRLFYDALGRLVEQVEPDLTSSWVYDVAVGKGVGQLAMASTTAGYSRVISYNGYGQPATAAITVDGTAYTYSLGYDGNSRLQTEGYPSGFTARYNRTTFGYLNQVTDNGSQTFWTANTRDAELHVLTQTAGNSVVTTQTFDITTGQIRSTLAGPSNAVANQSYNYDVLGNLTDHSWLNNSGATVREIACYDPLNRLTQTALAASGNTCTGTGLVTAVYDPLGNITEKTDICSTANCMVYGGGSSGGGLHALTSIVGTYNGFPNPSFSYDNNGNMTGGAGHSVTYTSFNMAQLITSGANSVTLTYDSEHSRIKQVTAGTTAGTTTYLNDPFGGATEEKYVVAGSATWRDYIVADGQMIALRSVGNSSPPVWGSVVWGAFSWTASSATTPVVLYFTLDHLGSISVITDASGHVAERDSYDAWGKRRNPDGTPAACGTIGISVTRGFTGQEMMDSICYINFNARVYDPSLGRFMSADPVVGDVSSLQAINRYSYVLNNPLSLTDPTGLCVFGCFWNSPIFRELVAIAVAIALQQEWALPSLEGGLDADVAAVINGGIGGGVAGAISSGTLKGAGLGALQGGLFAVAGNIVDPYNGAPSAFLGDHTLDVLVSHGLVGGLVSVVGGGNFGSGFLAAGVSSFAPDPVAGQSFGQTIVGTAQAAMLGGIGADLGGGKFLNGAETGAFGYLFNGAAHAGNGHNNSLPTLDADQDIGLAAKILSGIFSESPIGVFLETLFTSTPTANDTLVTQTGIARIEQHLSNLDALDWPPNQAMIARLQAGDLTPEDFNFYMHELHEADLMDQGMDYQAAHDATLKWQGITYGPGYQAKLFAPAVIWEMPDAFPPAAQRAVGIKGP